MRAGVVRSATARPAPSTAVCGNGESAPSGSCLKPQEAVTSATTTAASAVRADMAADCRLGRMARRGSLFWAILVVVTAGALVYGPAYLAGRATAAGEPVDFLTRPQDGWRFLLDVVPAVGDARARTVADARRLALRGFAGSVLRPTRVGL